MQAQNTCVAKSIVITPRQKIVTKSTNNFYSAKRDLNANVKRPNDRKIHNWWPETSLLHFAQKLEAPITMAT